ncbi:unnamed protein product [Pleuronectes platessa]|uniref:Uncharacterized protein n=1 Tax=Pleuronectes platessa TaxID=8262 RepID=A0A9N7URT7_PLEPL|nr:unnamed protein product [Pleuronectes platessa]
MPCGGESEVEDEGRKEEGGEEGGRVYETEFNTGPYPRSYPPEFPHQGVEYLFSFRRDKQVEGQSAPSILPEDMGETGIEKMKDEPPPETQPLEQRADECSAGHCWSSTADMDKKHKRCEGRPEIHSSTTQPETLDRCRGATG